VNLGVTQPVPEMTGGGHIVFPAAARALLALRQFVGGGEYVFAAVASAQPLPSVVAGFDGKECERRKAGESLSSQVNVVCHDLNMSLAPKVVKEVCRAPQW
jgi:hypothetical protein